MGEYVTSDNDDMRNIQPVGKRFHVAKVTEGVRYLFGSFKELDVAMAARNALKETGWSIDFFKDNNIICFNETFYIFLINEKNRLEFINSATSAKEARIKLKVHHMINSYSNDNRPTTVAEYCSDENIIKEDGKFKVIRDGVVFSETAVKHVAYTIRNLLKDNDWDINFFKDNNVVHFRNWFYVFFIEDEQVQFIGRYVNRDAAARKLNKTFNRVIIPVEDEEEIVEEIEVEEVIEEVPYKFDKVSTSFGDNEDLVKVDKQVAVSHDFDGQTVTFGQFTLKTVAVVVRNFLRKNNWDIDAFDDNNIFQVKNWFYVYVKEDNWIKFIGKYINRGAAEDKLNRYYN